MGPLLDARLDSRQDSPPPSFDPAIAPPFQLPDAYRVSPQGLAAYQALIRQAREESIRTGRPVLVIDKAAHELDLYRAGEVEATWPVELGHNPVDDKLMEGDRATPEGRYVVEQFKDVGQTRFYRALLLNYPNADDLARFRELQKAGEIPDSATPGSLIEIHGHGSGLGIHGYDWTLGCIALSDADMDELINAGAGKGTVVFIVRYGARHDYTLSGQ